MSDFKLIIGNKKYSSWSLRPWLAMKVKGIDFEEELFQFDHSTMPHNKHFWAFSPTKAVPVLKWGQRTIWDSLAIMEFLAEQYPEKGLWPADHDARIHARCASNEMHSGFFALRSECPMNMARTPSKIDLSDACKLDIMRIETMFAECFGQYGGPYLFGDFTIVDAMYAPVANRLRIYKLSTHPAVTRFCEVIEGIPDFQEWKAAGQAEPWVCEIAEV